MTNFIYLISSVCFILSLKGLSSPKSAQNGNTIGIVGMGLAIAATYFFTEFHNSILITIAIGIGAFVGVSIAKQIPMTSMPQLVAAFHSLVGLAATLVAYSALLSPENYKIGLQGSISTSSLIEMSLGAIIGAITFSGSIIAFMKLQGLISGAPFKFYMQKYVNIACLMVIVTLILTFVASESHVAFIMSVILALIFGLLLILPVGGADMPVVVSMLNSYSGFAASGIGFTLQNNLLIITGALVGASGAILSHVMCTAMNRTLINVIFGAFFEQQGSVDAKGSTVDDRPIKIGSTEDAAFMLSNAESCVIVPGYGMAVSHAQHAIKEMVNKLIQKGVNVKFAIHPVAGRMPGHMNVLLAEAGIDYDMVFELEDINSEFAATDVVLVIGANDVTNPAAKTDKASPIYGMPILEVENAKTVFFIKRGMNKGYAGVENELFYKENTQMLFGDAKKVVEELVKNLEE